MKKISKTAIIVTCVVAFILSLGIGIMMSGERESLQTISIANDSIPVMVDTVSVDTLNP